MRVGRNLLGNLIIGGWPSRGAAGSEYDEGNYGTKGLHEGELRPHYFDNIVDHEFGAVCGWRTPSTECVVCIPARAVLISGSNRS